MISHFFYNLASVLIQGFGSQIATADTVSSIELATGLHPWRNQIELEVIPCVQGH
jgi:hypothetical protein